MTDVHYPSARRPVDEVIRTLTLAARQRRSTSPPSWQDIDVAIGPTAHPGRTWEPDAPRGAFEPRPSSCAVDVHAPPCSVEVYFARPWQPIPGMVHRAPKVERAPLFEVAIGPVRVALLADLGKLLAAVDSGRAPRGPAPMPRYHGRPAARAVEVSPLPVVPELVSGADAAARRDAIERAAVLIRGTVELAALLETAPPDVAARARRALAALSR